MGLDDHPAIPGCRVTYFASDNDGSFSPLLLSDMGTQNQSVIFYNGQIAAAGANHHVYGGYSPLQLWLFDPQSSGSESPGSFSPGTYLIGSPYLIDGGFYQAYWGYPPAAQVYPNNQPNAWQQFVFATAGNGFTICNVSNGACLTDGGSTVDIGQGVDAWAIAASGSGWTLRNNRTGNYMASIPTTARANVHMSAAPVSINLTGILSHLRLTMSFRTEFGSFGNLWIRQLQS